MRLLRRICTAVNRPLPAWLTLVLIFGTVAGAASPVFNGSLNIPAGGSLTTAGTATTTIGGPTTISYPRSDTILNITSQGSYRNELQLHHADPACTFAAGCRIGDIRWFEDSFASKKAADILVGPAGSVSGNYGTYMVFSTKIDGSASLEEDLVLDHQGHIRLPGDSWSVSATSPASCSANVECLTVRYTFPMPFIRYDGAPEVPWCSNPSVQDTTTPTDMWMGNINSVSNTGVTYNIGPTSATAAAKRLMVTFTCWTSSY